MHLLLFIKKCVVFYAILAGKIHLQGFQNAGDRFILLSYNTHSGKI